MRGLLWFALIVAGLATATADAALRRDPTGVNVSTSGPTTLTIRFADDAGGTFITTDAFFCSVDPTGGAGVISALANSCGTGAGAGGVILGRLPAALDRGSTTSGRSSITDIMTIPFSVARRAVVQARQGQFSDFFYVRRFDPVGGADLGAGAGVPVLVVVTCRLTGGTARVPLSLTQVILYGDEGGDAGRILLIRMNEENRAKGVVKADIQYTGTGILSGWWEVRTPTDPPIREIDLFTEGSLSETDRAQQQRFQRVKRFRQQVPLSGRLTLNGPRYSELPQATPGVYEILLRVEATQDREQLSTLTDTGGSTNLFSGAAAGFPLPVLEYRLGPGVGPAGGVVSRLAPRLVIDTRPDGQRQVGVRWLSPPEGAAPYLQVEAEDPQSGRKFRILAPMAAGFVVLPPAWTIDLDPATLRYTVTALGADGQSVGEPMLVQR